VALLFVIRVIGLPLAVAGTVVAAGTAAGLGVPNKPRPLLYPSALGDSEESLLDVGNEARDLVGANGAIRGSVSTNDCPQPVLAVCGAVASR